jgi:hypothetical protein
MTEYKTFISPATARPRSLAGSVLHSPPSATTSNWAVIQSDYDLGHSVCDGQQRFGFSDRSWSAAVF